MNSQKQKEKNWILQEKYSGQESEAFKIDLKRLQAGEPVAYIIGFVDFLGCRIDLSEKPLIPRPETEFWTELAITKIKKSDLASPYCLDIFSGSGCIGIAILKHIPMSKVVFVEKSSRFCRQIEKNLVLNNISKERYQIIKANVFRSQEAEKHIYSFDYILANPPYIPLERKDKLAKGVVNWEPQEALFTKDNGLLIIKRFLLEVSEHLNSPSTSQVWLEFDISQHLLIKELLINGGFTDIVFHKDQYSRWRFVTFSSPAKVLVSN